MGRHDDAQADPCWSRRHVRAVVERAHQLTFRAGELLLGGKGQASLPLGEAFAPARRCPAERSSSRAGKRGRLLCLTFHPAAAGRAPAAAGALAPSPLARPRRGAVAPASGHGQGCRTSRADFQLWARLRLRCACARLPHACARSTQGHRPASCAAVLLAGPRSGAERALGPPRACQHWRSPLARCLRAQPARRSCARCKGGRASRAASTRERRAATGSGEKHAQKARERRACWQACSRDPRPERLRPGQHRLGAGFPCAFAAARLAEKDGHQVADCGANVSAAGKADSARVMASRTPCLRRCAARSTTSPNQGGGKGAECAEVWMLTGAYALLVIGPP